MCLFWLHSDMLIDVFYLFLLFKVRMSKSTENSQTCPSDLYKISKIDFGLAKPFMHSNPIALINKWVKTSEKEIGRLSFKVRPFIQSSKPNHKF